MYNKEYPKFPEHINIQGFEIPVPLPKKPKPQEFRNYGLPIKDQKFKRDLIPKDVGLMDKIALEKFISEQWHKRKNGEWWMIKGQEIYVTGPAWFFFNHWETKKGGKPDFRIEAVEWFLVWDFVQNDPNCFGLFDIKCRRLGDTEKALCAGYEMVTRYRQSDFGMQNINKDEAHVNFKRVVKAHKKMAKWFKPINTGSDEPEDELIFREPSKAITSKSVREGKQDIEEFDAPVANELNSTVTFRATREKLYDGHALRYYHLDEPGKLSPKDMNVIRQWNIIRQSLSRHNEMQIVGKAVFTTTVEDMANGETVKVCRELWQQSNPNSRSAVGRTASGLYRYFRNFLLGAEVDEWGFHKTEEAKAFRQAQIKEYLRIGDLDTLSSYKRKAPETIEESLAVPAHKCVLLPALLDLQMQRVTEWGEHNKRTSGDSRMVKYPEAVCGDFVWTNGFKSDVKFVPKENGKFWVSGHPAIPNNKYIQDSKLFPANKGQFTIGVDGIDHKGDKGSDFAMAVFATWNPKSETALQWEHGELGAEITNKWAMKTRRFVCTYSYRPHRPDEAYEDCLKCAMYYGVPMFAERQRPGVLRYFEQHGMYSYCSWKPRWMKGSNLRERDAGLHQTKETNLLWLDEIIMHVHEFSETYVHMNQLSVFRQFDGENNGDCDIVVASGLALAEARGYAIQQKREEQVMAYDEFPFDTFEAHYN